MQDFAARDKYKPVLLRLSMAGNLEKPLVSLYGIEWRDGGCGLRSVFPSYPVLISLYK
jgi:hypothetical protein